jgi:hypothetical protein
VLIFKILVLVALVRLLIATNKPWVCAGVYAGIAAVSAMMSTGNLTTALVTTGIGFFGSGVYFWLLNRFDGSFIWWIILVVGIVIAFF